MRISDWSSDVCSSDLHLGIHVGIATDHANRVGQLPGQLQVNPAAAHLAGGNLKTVIRRIAGQHVFLGQVERCGGEPQTAVEQVRSDERRGGKECVSPCRSRWSTYP